MSERDRDPTGRARNARPRDGLGRPLPRDAAGVARVPDELVLPPVRSLMTAQALLDAGQPFHAHEVLEGTWKAAPADERGLWQGLAQLAVGLTHRARGNEVGAARLLERGVARIRPYERARPYGIPVGELCAAATTLARDPRADPPLRLAPPVRDVLRLRPLRLDDEPAVRAAREVLLRDTGGAFDFTPGWEPGQPWPDFVTAMAELRRGRAVPPGWVAATFLVADVGGEIVGRTSVRHGLTDVLLREGGHIGYGVLPEHRRRGYATEILRQSLVLARAEGVDRVLVTCDDDNAGSIAVVEACGGRLDPDLTTVPGSGPGAAVKRRYWID